MQEFTDAISRIFERTKTIQSGKARDESKKDLYAVSICTVKGEKFNLGDYNDRFLLESVFKPVAYTMAVHERGVEYVHRFVGQEPSGVQYNAILLNEDNLPHNPMINAGALMTTALILPGSSVDARYEHIKSIWSKLCGNTSVELNEENFKSSEKSAGTMRNLALCYHMKDQGTFSERVNIDNIMELYRKCCALEINNEQLAVAAATLANGGICPLTQDRVFDNDSVRDCLSIMLSCGMYNHSGEFIFKIGLPAKSGVSGAMMVVVPGRLGIAIYSPPLDEKGNPVRGIEFCEELVKEYDFHLLNHMTRSFYT